jgi:hypothetical protein
MPSEKLEIRCVIDGVIHEHERSSRSSRRFPCAVTEIVESKAGVAWGRIATLGADPKVEGLGSQLKSVSDELKSQVKLRTNLDGLSLLLLDQGYGSLWCCSSASFGGRGGPIQTGSKNGLALP